ncbi:CotH kinase family protein [candidate division KSB1 bacterium]|nr:CotH kinase family protein [candidate division KSB1 bacterium]
MSKYLLIISLLSIILIFQFSLLPAQELFINEIMPSNLNIITDEDGEYPDWIEIFNYSQRTINLSGYGISDNESRPFKWFFPEYEIKSGEFLVIFASDKDRRTTITHWETIVNRGDIWRYRLGYANIPSDWYLPNYNDTAWPTGPSGFGYGDNDDATTVASTMSLYIRHTFTLNQLENISAALLHVDYDDGFVAYLNGVEIARANLGAPGDVPAYNQSASASHEAEIYQGNPPEQYRIASFQTLLQEGKNVLAIQVHNTDASSSDLTIIPFFTVGLKNPPTNPKGAPAILKVQIPKFHTNFKISASGETLLLSDPNGNIVDKVTTENIPEDVSWGRQPDGSANWFLFNQSTPGASNLGQGASKMAKEPQFSRTGGFYPDRMSIELSTQSPTSTIFYTLDGSEPKVTSPVYSKPILIQSTTVVRAKTYGANLLPSKTITHTYFINSKPGQSTLPVFSLVTTPDNLFNIENGIYTLGRNAQNSNPYYGANFWQDWERPVHVEFFESNGTPGFIMDAGIKIIGGWSRANPQKPLAIFARNEYGYGEINYRLFPELPFEEFQAFILRTGGNDWGRTFFSDGLMHGLVEDVDLENTAFRPCVIYINGEYWGILNLREKQNEHYLAMYHAVNPDSIDMLEMNGSPIHGDAAHYNKLINFISNNDLSRPENYEYVKTQMDVDNFIEYNVAQIYFDNRDWPGNNIKFWRPRTKTGKWRWLLYDTDWGYGVNAYGRGGNQYPFDYNTLDYATSPQQTPNHHANAPWSTLLLRTLLNNEEFKNNFINRFADRFNTIFRAEIAVEKINQIKKMLEPEMQQQLNKWSYSYPLWSRHQLYWDDMGTWNSYIQIMIDFANYRIPYTQAHIINKFKLGGVVYLTLDVLPSVGGFIKINSIYPEQFPWQGQYFMNTPISVKAIPYPGYRFIGWQGFSTSISDSISIKLSRATSLRALFEPISESLQPIIINEINYNSNLHFNPEDWVELFNNSESAVDISGWELQDADDAHRFYLPQNTILDSQKYLVVCRDTSAFKTFFPKVKNFIGNFDFGLNESGESVRLYDKKGIIIDSIAYSNRYPWPIMPDGGGSTLELKNPGMDNALVMSWKASQNYGTPGAKNSVSTTLSVESSPSVIGSFKLFPNYPNPFNGTTTIAYELTAISDVEISIFNIKGQLITKFVDKNMLPGHHTIKWSAPQLSSGIYIYKIMAGKNLATGKCMLLK